MVIADGDKDAYIDGKDRNQHIGINRVTLMHCYGVLAGHWRPKQLEIDRKV